MLTKEELESLLFIPIENLSIERLITVETKTVREGLYGSGDEVTYQTGKRVGYTYSFTSIVNISPEIVNNLREQGMILSELHNYYCKKYVLTEIKYQPCTWIEVHRR